jgi:hypothetical protein
MKCSKCGSSKLISIKKEGEFCTNFARFNSMSDDDKKNMLHKRTQLHNNSPSSIEEKKHIERQLYGKARH